MDLGRTRLLNEGLPQPRQQQPHPDSAAGRIGGAVGRVARRQVPRRSLQRPGDQRVFRTPQRQPQQRQPQRQAQSDALFSPASTATQRRVQQDPKKQAALERAMRQMHKTQQVHVGHSTQPVTRAQVRGEVQQQRAAGRMSDRIAKMSQDQYVRRKTGRLPKQEQPHEMADRLRQGARDLKALLSPREAGGERPKVYVTRPRDPRHWNDSSKYNTTIRKPADDSDYHVVHVENLLRRSPLICENVVRHQPPGQRATPGFLSNIANRVRVVGQKIAALGGKKKRLQEPAGGDQPSRIVKRTRLRSRVDPHGETQAVPAIPGEGAMTDDDKRVPATPRRRGKGDTQRLPRPSRRELAQSHDRARSQRERFRIAKAETRRLPRLESDDNVYGFETSKKNPNLVRIVKRNKPRSLSARQRLAGTEVVPLRPGQQKASKSEKQRQAREFASRERPQTTRRRLSGVAPDILGLAAMQRKRAETDDPSALERFRAYLADRAKGGRGIREAVVAPAAWVTGVKPGSSILGAPGDKDPHKSAFTTASTGFGTNLGSAVPSKAMREFLKKQDKKKPCTSYKGYDAITRELADGQPANRGGVATGLAMLKRSKPRLLGS